MRLAWFTPLSQKSAIARFSAAVTASLSHLVEVDVCYFDSEDIRETAATARRFTSAAAIDDATLKAYDIVIYNLGNYLPFHREIYLLSQRWPGVCILHDFVMHHFFAAYYFDYRRDPDAYRLLIGRHYGSTPSLTSRLWETDDVVKYPLFEEAIRGALGVVAHSRFLKERVEACFAGPVNRISLAYDVGPARSQGPRSELRLTAGQVLIVTVGHVNPNKQVERVIDALAELGPTSKSVVYAVVGSCAADYERKLKSKVAGKGLGEQVRFLGQVSDDLLASYLSAADICINLRFPVTEGASASAIEEMLFGKPVIVCDSGFFSELPDRCVVKVRPDGGSAEVAGALRTLIADPSLREHMGADAKAYAEAEFHPDHYARSLMEFIWEVQSSQPLLSLADRVGVELCRMGVDSTMKILDVISHGIEDAFVIKRPQS